MRRREGHVVAAVCGEAGLGALNVGGARSAAPSNLGQGSQRSESGHRQSPAACECGGIGFVMKSDGVARALMAKGACCLR